jgi:hypothetical protein
MENAQHSPAACAFDAGCLEPNVLLLPANGVPRPTQTCHLIPTL